LVAAAAILGVGAYFDRLTALDGEFAVLQKRAVQLVRQTPETSAPAEAFKNRFWPPGPLPEPLTFATSVQQMLRAAGLGVTGSRVLPGQPTNTWVEFQVDGNIEEWFRFLKDLRTHDPRTVFRSLSLVRRAGTQYTIVFEVGHVVLP
jgi:hypothetical protein